MRNFTKGFSLLLFSLSASFSLFAQVQEEEQLLGIVRKNGSLLHVSQEDARNVAMSSTFTDAQSGIRYLYLQQTYGGIPVYNQIKTVAMKNNQIVYSSGNFVENISLKVSGITPSVNPEAAVAKAAQLLELSAPQGLKLQKSEDGGKKLSFSAAGISKKTIDVSLVFVPVNNGTQVQLAWNVNIDVLGSPDWWNVRIDALSGSYINKDNWTVHEQHGEYKPQAPARVQGTAFSGQRTFSPPSTTNGAYRVVPFPVESPMHGNVSIDNEPWLKAGVTNNATTFGWHFDGNNNYTTTQGNNVHAYLDLNNSNVPSGSNIPATSTTGAPALSFTFTPNFGLQPADATNQSFAVTNLFYWNNMMHDVMYQYGFTEAAGNFQSDNMGRGGSDADYVKAEGQDGGGTSNANFSTPVDGQSGRMQMYIFPNTVVASVQANSPATLAGNYTAIESGFSINNKLTTTGPKTGDVVYINDDNLGTLHEGCTPPVNTLTGKIALIDRGNCNFTVKVKNAQDAGAIAVIMINNIAGDPIVMGGTDDNIMIPAVMITQDAGALFVARLLAGNTVNATLRPPVNFDGDVDNGVITHEYGHGISTRLTGGRLNSSCLTNAESGGEGWSDYFALMMTTNWNTALLTDGPKARPMGTYVVGQSAAGSGIRRNPYSTNMTINPVTYAFLSTSGEVHDIGEIWCSAVWDMTWNIIQQENSITANLYNSAGTGGNVVALRLVMEGLKLQPCSPGFLDARNAILAADSIVYNGKYKCAIWNAFARRGMGVSAIQGSPASTSDQTPAFDVPSGISLKKQGSPVIINTGAQGSFTISATCGCAALSNVTIRDTIPSGFSYLSSVGGSASGNIISFPAQSFAARETKSYSFTIAADPNAGCTIDTAVNDNRDNTTKGGLASSGTVPWALSNTQAKSPANSWFAVDATSAADFSLTSNSFLVSSLATLSFWQYYYVENQFDGGRVEISSDGGTSWNDLGPYIIQTPYNGTMAGAPWGTGQKAFTGTTNQGFVQTVIDLSAFNGQTVKVRFRFRTDAGNPGSLEGWYIDDIMFTTGCGGMMKAGAYNSSNVLQDNMAVPVYRFGNQIITAIPTVNNDGVSLGIAPNPAKDQTVLSFSQPVSAPEITVHDLNGKLVQSIQTGRTVSTYTLSTISLAEGTYIVTVRSKKMMFTTKLVIVR
jgi:extracellular elastinolytic metalloproteinase